MTCTKHAERFLDWEDHSRPIVCAICEIHRLRALLRQAIGAMEDGEQLGPQWWADAKEACKEAEQAGGGE